VWYAEGWLVNPGPPADAEAAWSISSETRVQNGAYECRWNGSTIGSGSSSPNYTLEGLAINAGGVPSETSTCQVAEIILYTSVLNKPQILGLEAYLKNKWAI
jgi:hypothetical protein